MKKLLQPISVIALIMFFSVNLQAQTDGTLTFSFTPVTKSPGYSGTKNALAVWIQTSTGGFVKTKLRYAGPGGGTSDHLPTWAANASCAYFTGYTIYNATSTACNKTDATTGATLTTFSAKSFTWDGKGVNGTLNGSTVADGVYKVSIEECWNHGTTGNIVKSYTFTKGPHIDSLSPANDAYFTNVQLKWTPAGSPTGGVESVSEGAAISIYPNPNSDGIFHIDFEKASRVKVVNTLGMVVYDEKVEQATGTKAVDLTGFSNGIYFIYVLDGDKSSKHKVILNK